MDFVEQQQMSKIRQFGSYTTFTELDNGSICVLQLYKIKKVKTIMLTFLLHCEKKILN
jgi:hypothetical protein